MISVGIDVSKGKSTICIVNSNGEVLKEPKDFMHSEEAINSLIEKIKSYEEELKVVMEATGHYHLPVLQKLIEAGISVSVINPLVMKRYASASIRKGKTDKLDAMKIASYGIMHWSNLQEYRLTNEVYDELKLLSRQYLQYVGMKVKAKNMLGNLLDQTMPGIKKIISGTAQNPKKNKLNAFVYRYWHYDNITKMSERRFINSYQKWAEKEGYHQSETKARVIYALAADSIPTLDSKRPSTKMFVLESVRTLRLIDSILTIILSRMKELAKSLPEYEVVSAMNGVGEVLSVRLIAEIGDVRRFHSKKALIAYAGIDAPPFQSGSFYGKNQRISKRGSKSLRKTGYEVMKCIKCVKPTKDNAVYEFMIKKELEGKPKKVAKIAGLNKFLRIYYARVLEAYDLN